MNHQDLYKLIQTVQKNVRCPQCGQSYHADMIRIRGIVESVVFLELNCSDHMPLLATVAINEEKPTTKKKKKSEQITSNDVLETHKFLKDFTGGFEKIFKNNLKQ